MDKSFYLRFTSALFGGLFGYGRSSGEAIFGQLVCSCGGHCGMAWFKQIPARSPKRSLACCLIHPAARDGLNQTVRVDLLFVGVDQ